MNEYYPGQGVVLECQFIDANGALVDPTTVTFYYKKPDASAVVTVAQGSLTHPSTGVWRYLLDTTGFPVGDVHAKMVGTGAALGRGDDRFRILRDQVA